MKIQKTLLYFGGGIVLFVGLPMALVLMTSKKPVVQSQSRPDVSSSKMASSSSMSGNTSIIPGDDSDHNQRESEVREQGISGSQTITGQFVDQAGNPPRAMVGVLINDVFMDSENVAKWEGYWVLPIARDSRGSFRIETTEIRRPLHLAAWSNDGDVALESFLPRDGRETDFGRIEFRKPSSLEIFFSNVPENSGNLQLRLFRLNGQPDEKINPRRSVPGERYWLQHLHPDIYAAYDWPPEDDVESSRSGMWDQSLEIDPAEKFLIPALIPDEFVQLTFRTQGQTYSNRLTVPLTQNRSSSIEIDWNEIYPEGTEECFDISGMISYPGTNNGIPGARISFSGLSMVSDESGKFSIPCLPESDHYDLVITVPEDEATQSGILRETHLRLPRLLAEKISVQGSYGFEAAASTYLTLSIPEGVDDESLKWVVETEMRPENGGGWIIRTPDHIEFDGHHVIIRTSASGKKRISAFSSALKGYTTGDINPGEMIASLLPMTSKDKLTIEVSMSGNEYPVSGLPLIITADPMGRELMEFITNEYGEVTFENISADYLFVTAGTPPRQREFLMPLMLNPDDRISITLEEGTEVLKPLHQH